jgi:hypothetical protein
LDKSTIFRKSAKGQEAFSSRQSGLPPKLRSLLILVDGKRPVSELAKMALAPAELDPMLEVLEAEGYIESDSRRRAAFEDTATVPQPLMKASGPAPLAAGPTAAPETPVPAPSPAPAPAPPTVQAPAAPVTLAQAKQLAARLVTSALGPVGEELCMRIEASRSLADYTAAVKRAYGVIREVRGGAAAAQFGQQIEANLPPA